MSYSNTFEDAQSTPQFATLYAEVALPLHLDKTLTYLVKPELSRKPQIGCRIVVPLGKKLVTGYIVGLSNELPAMGVVIGDVKEAHEVLDDVPVCTPEVLELTRWVSNYYASPWGEVIKGSLPPGISPSIDEYYSLVDHGEHEVTKVFDEPNSLRGQVIELLKTKTQVAKSVLYKQFPNRQLLRILNDLEDEGFITRSQIQSVNYTKAKVQRFVRLSLPSPLSNEQFTGDLSAAAKRIVASLESSGPISLQALLRESSASSSTVSLLERKGVLTTYEESVRRDPSVHPAEVITEYKLTSDQLGVLQSIKTQIATGTYGAFLLHGVTGSGKTEVYIQAMRASLALGKSSLMLVPEIALTPVFSRRLKGHFGDQVAIFHSSLQKGERFDEWSRVREGTAKIVIGTRSAVFAPINNLGLIVIDEEHESSYRQQDYPYYNARDTAIVRARLESAAVVLGSATPSLESFQNAQRGKYKYLNLPQRIGPQGMATARLIDMRQVFDQQGKAVVFSDELLAAIRQTHERNEQSIILLNRRGYSRFVLCRSCGESVQCPNCDVTLTYHRSDRVMLCHYCNHRQPPPSVCGACGKKYIYYVGEGTEQLEEMLRQLFPSLQIARIDRDTTSRRKQFEQSLLDFSEGRIDMLVGTQMLAKGHDFPNVTLVGVISVDAGLALPDFRAAERTFQLITQVAGRAGRGDRPGKVLIQTYHPDHYALRHACAQNYESFFNEEIRYRRHHSYPPFVALASFVVHGPSLDRVRAHALELKTQLDLANADRTIRILGPAPAPLARLKGEHRFQLILKSSSRQAIRNITDIALKALEEKKINLRTINLEIDPVSIM